MQVFLQLGNYLYKTGKTLKKDISTMEEANMSSSRFEQNLLNSPFLYLGRKNKIKEGIIILKTSRYDRPSQFHPHENSWNSAMCAS